MIRMRRGGRPWSAQCHEYEVKCLKRKVVIGNATFLALDSDARMRNFIKVICFKRKYDIRLGVDTDQMFVPTLIAHTADTRLAQALESNSGERANDLSRNLIEFYIQTLIDRKAKYGIPWDGDFLELKPEEIPWPEKLLKRVR